MTQDDCLTLFTSATDWYAAEETCAERDGHLASITSGSANLFVRQQAREHQWSADYWIGGSNEGGEWAWSDGAPFEYRWWANGQYAIGDALCIAANTSTGLWTAAYCYDAKPFVCKFPAVNFEESPKPTPPPGSPAGGPKPSSPAGGHPTPPPGNHTHPHGPPAGPQVTCEKEWTYSGVTGKCYKVVTNEQGWGQQICDGVSATVLSIHSALENEVALSISIGQTSANQSSPTTGVTIGLRQSSQLPVDEKWEWTDGSPVDYTNWSSVDGEFMFCSTIWTLELQDCFALFQIRSPSDGKVGQWVGHYVTKGWPTICVKAPT